MTKVCDLVWNKEVIRVRVNVVCQDTPLLKTYLGHTQTLLLAFNLPTSDIQTASVDNRGLDQLTLIVPAESCRHHREDGKSHLMNCGQNIRTLRTS